MPAVKGKFDFARSFTRLPAAQDMSAADVAWVTCLLEAMRTMLGRAVMSDALASAGPLPEQPSQMELTQAVRAIWTVLGGR